MSNEYERICNERLRLINVLRALVIYLEQEHCNYYGQAFEEVSQEYKCAKQLLEDIG